MSSKPEIEIIAIGSHIHPVPTGWSHVVVWDVTGNFLCRPGRSMGTRFEAYVDGDVEVVAAFAQACIPKGLHGNVVAFDPEAADFTYGTTVRHIVPDGSVVELDDGLVVAEDRIRSALIYLNVHLSRIEGSSYDGNQAGRFGICLEDGTEVDFLGIDTVGFAFKVRLPDGFETEVGYDPAQMPTIGDDLTAFQDIAADPLSWCKDAAAIATRQRDESIEEAAA